MFLMAAGIGVVWIRPLNAADPCAGLVGMKMIRVGAGRFMMGEAEDDEQANWYETPAHTVVVSQPFYISATEVTVEQFREFRKDFEGTEEFYPYAAGVSWYDAAAFCEWLSRKEGRPYRLPTEAEWEYACRAGSTAAFSPGDSRPQPETANAWGLKNMHTGVREWCLDWFGEYPADAQTDPVGPEYGLAKVVRGGGLESDNDKYARCASRCAIAPGFGIMPSIQVEGTPTLKQGQFGRGLTGTRFANPDFTRPEEAVRLDEPDKNWSGINLAHDWSDRYWGYIEGPVTAEVTFTAEADSGVTLVVDGQVVLSGRAEEAALHGTVSMVRGKKYPVELSYFQDQDAEHQGLSYLRVYWSWAGHDRTIVSAEALSHSAEQQRLAEKNVPPAPRNPGFHNIGFRVVQAPMPATRPLSCERPFVRECVRQGCEPATIGPDPNKPYFRKRYLLPVPPDNSSPAEITGCGLHPALRRHNHSPALEVCPNGDVLMVIYTSYHEYEPEVSLMATRLRFGADQWDMPSYAFDFVGANDHAPLLWNDNGVIYLFWGNPDLEGAYPFQWTSSADNGATWSEVKFPQFKGRIYPHSRQPINTALRDNDGAIYVPGDGRGSRSVLWVSRDNGRTWYDTGARTAGRHTTFVLLKNGCILGMGGKDTSVNGYMPKVVSCDGGHNWLGRSATVFPAVGGNQRPCVQRLASGRLFFAGDFQRSDGSRPTGATAWGAYVALSDDDGDNWHIKKLMGTQQHENPQAHAGADTIGYSVARQGINGVIHLITSMNRPCLHFAMNEAWILDRTGDGRNDTEPMKSSATEIANVEQYQERYAGDKIKVRGFAGIGNDGRYLMHGTQTSYYSNGKKQWEVTYILGQKTGLETYRRPDGSIEWQWNHRSDGSSVWTQYWGDGQKKSESTWKNFECDGLATAWDRSGKVSSKKVFSEGKIRD